MTADFLVSAIIDIFDSRRPPTIYEILAAYEWQILNRDEVRFALNHYHNVVSLDTVRRLPVTKEEIN